MIKEFEKIIDQIYSLPYSKEAKEHIYKSLDKLERYIGDNHFFKTKEYISEINDIRELSDDLSSSFIIDEDRLLQRRIQKKLTSLIRTVIDENKKIFVVHGRNHSIRDKVTSLLGRLKLDYVVLETEHNGGVTIIEKFLRNANDCRYAIILFSADDVGKYDHPQEIFKSRTRQNVVLELGYFLGTIGRENIVILHEAAKEIERPSDFDGIVYEPFDEFGAWKTKLIKEMKRAKIYIDSNLADRV